MIDNSENLLKMVINIGLYVGIAYCMSFFFTASSQALFSSDSESPDSGIPSKNRYELKKECLKELNNQINSELYASMVYMNMGTHFDNNQIARKGFSKFFSDQSREEKEHAHKLADYINKRGGTVDTLNVNMPNKNSWVSFRQALEESLKLENEINNYIHKIHSIAEQTCKDPHLMDFLESEYLEEQISSINQITRLLAILNQMDGGVGEYMLDRQILKGDIKPEDI